ncbi:hypothetical protein chiPu_0004082 [Chiloscyllium punctatum]|uniref:Uncharacterized protein n=1 Tax=Chiloscyllium punctatum TaxID=137246 RepID=A0A401S5J6_CHIPU|nr:hypothetical protein [Chiloscyllium punctatum]
MCSPTFLSISLKLQHHCLSQCVLSLRTTTAGLFSQINDAKKIMCQIVIGQVRKIHLDPRTGKNPKMQVAECPSWP